MSIFKFSQKWVTTLIKRANQSPRLRQHCNIHRSYADPCQCLFNAIGVNSYIRPHRHSLDSKIEYLIAIKGLFALITFFDNGEIQKIDYFGTELHQQNEQVNAGVLIYPKTWHTVIALIADSVLMEIKPGPFLINADKEYSPWSPEEESHESVQYFSEIKHKTSLVDSLKGLPS